MHGIKMQEGGGKVNYNAMGDNGTAAGAGQWSNQPDGKPSPLYPGQVPSNFANSAKEYGLDPTDFSPDNQNKVLYQEVYRGKQSGLTPEQILSRHNSGDPNKYLSSSATGTGSVGPYDVATYVRNGMSYAQEYAKKNKPQAGPSYPLNTQQPQQNSADAASAQQYGATFPSKTNEGGIMAGLKAVGNLPGSALNFAEGLGNAVIHPIKTAESLGNTVIGGIGEATGTSNPNDPATQAFEGLKSSLYNRYGTLENAARSATNDPFGVGSDIVGTVLAGSQAADLLTGAKTAEAAKAADYISNTGKTMEDALADPDYRAAQAGFHNLPGGPVDNIAVTPETIATVQKNIVDGLPTQVGEGLDANVAKKIAALKPENYSSVEDFVKDAQKIATEGKGLYSSAVGTGISKAASVPLAPARAVANGLYKLGTGITGKALGVEGGTVREGVNATVTGGPAYQAFKEGLTGNVSQDDLVNQARGALKEVSNTRSQTYQKMLASLKGDSTTYDISPVYREADSQLQKFGITKTKDGLDFSRSKFALDPSGQRDIENLYNYVKGYGLKPGDRTALGVDNLKKVLGGYYSPNSDYRAFVQGVKGSARDVLDKAPGYTDAMKNYGDISDQIEDITKGLSLGDNAMVETSFKKITGAFRQNNEFRAQLVKELDNATGGQLLPKIAGQQMSSYLPRGLIGTLEGGGLGYTALSGGTGLVPLLFTMMATSPKLVANLIRTLRLPAAAANKAMALLSKGSVAPAIEAGSIANKFPKQQ